MPILCSLFGGFTNWALMVHIVVAQAEPPQIKTFETTTFLQESGFCVQWELFGHLCCFFVCVFFLVVVLVFL